MIAAMTTLSILNSSFLIALFCGIASQSMGHSPDLVEQAISPDQSIAVKAQDQLRLNGPRGLELLQQRFANEIALHRNGALSDARWKRIGAALDRVSGQYDDYSSGLFWYTNLQQAKAAARASGRPILSLHQINDWVYAQVFLTPKDDPWLGLAPPNVFAALDGNGESQGALTTNLEKR